MRRRFFICCYVAPGLTFRCAFIRGAYVLSQPLAICLSDSHSDDARRPGSLAGRSHLRSRALLHWLPPSALNTRNCGLCLDVCTSSPCGTEGKLFGVATWSRHSASRGTWAANSHGAGRDRLPDLALRGEFHINANVWLSDSWQRLPICGLFLGTARHFSTC